MSDSQNTPQWDYPNVDESPQLTSLLQTAGELFAKLDAIGGLSAVLGNCGSPGSVFTSQQQVAETRMRARKRQVRGPVDWISSAAGTASAADELQSLAGKDVFRCSCDGKWGVPETWGVPLSRVGHPFPDGLPKLKKLSASK